MIAPRGHRLIGAPRGLDSRNPTSRRGPWTDFRATPQGTGVSTDLAVAPSTSLRWFDQSFVGQAIRTEAGVSAHGTQVWGVKQLPKERRKQFESFGFHGRDVFSGVPLWRHDNFFITHTLPVRCLHPTPWALFIRKKKSSRRWCSRDARTGEIAVTYDKGLRMNNPWQKPKERTFHNTNGVLLVSGDILVQVYGTEIAALDIPTGDLLWKHALANPSDLGDRQYR